MNEVSIVEPGGKAICFLPDQHWSRAYNFITASGSNRLRHALAPDGVLKITTLEGVIEVQPGDWITRSADGKLGCRKPSPDVCADCGAEPSEHEKKVLTTDPSDEIHVEGYNRDEIIQRLCRKLMDATGKKVKLELLKRAKNMRNRPCPCGSNKKYKNCCEKKDIVFTNVVGSATLPR